MNMRDEDLGWVTQSAGADHPTTTGADHSRSLRPRLARSPGVPGLVRALVRLWIENGLSVGSNAPRAEALLALCCFAAALLAAALPFSNHPEFSSPPNHLEQAAPRSSRMGDLAIRLLLLSAFFICLFLGDAVIAGTTEYKIWTSMCCTWAPNT
jgi:hypothetical protein